MQQRQTLGLKGTGGEDLFARVQITVQTLRDGIRPRFQIVAVEDADHAVPLLNPYL